MIYSFGDYVLDVERYDLRYADQPVWVEPQVFSLLTYLVEHHDRVVSRQDLQTYLWPEQFIGDSALERCVMRARKAVGDSGGRQRMIKTFRRRGYRFVAPVSESLTESESSVLEPVSVGLDDHRSRPFEESPVALPQMALPSYARLPVGESFPTRVARVIDGPQRQQVTVLSCSLALVQDVDDANASTDDPAVLEWFFDSVAHQVHASGGLIAQFMDDSCLALFGTDRFDSDHALRAVKMALELQSSLMAGPPWPPWIDGEAPPVRMRIGLHSGDVISKQIGADARTIYMAVGDTMQFAANLQACAEPGCILVSEVTYRLVQEAVSGEVASRLAAVNAQPTPMAAYELYQ